jgi:hypothetical protein
MVSRPFFFLCSCARVDQDASPRERIPYRGPSQRDPPLRLEFSDVKFLLLDLRPQRLLKHEFFRTCLEKENQFMAAFDFSKQKSFTPSEIQSLDPKVLNLT